MPEPLIAPLAPGLTVRSNYKIRVTALDPASGAVVAGVVVSDVSLFVDTSEGSGLAEETHFQRIYLSQADTDLGRNPADFGGPGG